MFHPSRRLVAATAALSLSAAGVVAFAAPAAAAPGDLFISEYVEGSSNNKAIEIYNPSGAPVDLGAQGYTVQMYFNGGTGPTFTAALTGTVAPGDVFVFAHASSDAAILAQADQTTSAGIFNGDDAVVLLKGADVVDSIGQVGVDPGAEWGTGLTSTADNTLRRKADVLVGDTDPLDAFDPAVEWDGFANNTFDGLGWHLTPPEPEPGPEADCLAEPTPIGAVQGPGANSPLAGQVVLIEGVVVGDFQTGGFNGYYVQDAGDGDSATSDGIFVHAPGGAAVDVGDVVSVAGTASEQFGMTQVSAADVEICAVDQALPAPTALTLPAAETQREALEGMYVTLPQSLAIGGTFEFGRFGTITLTNGRLDSPTAIAEPGDAANTVAEANLRNSITLDDGRSNQNPDPAIHPNGQIFTLTNTFRSGDLVQNATGILDYRFDTWGVQPTQGADFTVANPRPEVPDVGGDLVVSSFNVLNYFTTLDSRGAITAEEFERQQAKIVAALAAIDADVFGLIEIENNGTAVAALTDALNAHLGADVYEHIETGVIGGDEIATAIIYKPETVRPAGAHALLTEAVDSRWSDARNRPALTQTFESVETGEKFTLSVNHLKSKGSACSEDPDAGDGQGNCSDVRAAAATALAEWLATDPTGQGTGDRALVMGDLNSYDYEDPIDALVERGFTDLVKQFHGDHAYSYVFDGQVGYLDHALAQEGLVADVTGASTWAINADEPSLIDYTMEFKQPAQDALYAPDPYRSSDHDPVIVGIDLADVTSPTIEVSVDPETVFPPNNKMRVIEFVIEAADDSGEVSVELTDVATSGSHKAEWEQTGDRTVEVRAANGARYTFTWTATDAAGNTATDTVTVVVKPKG